MTPGPTIIRRCSECAGLVAQDTIASGNTFGARLWTDGKREAPMLPDQPWLVKCPHCRALLWISELEEIAEVDWWREGRRDSFPEASRYDTPVLEDYLSLVEAGVGDRERERYVRLKAWWSGNDPRRRGAAELPLNPREIANLEAFARLLDESDATDLVMKAEIMRELGRPANAAALLERVTDRRLAEAATIIKRLVDRGERIVRELKPD